MTLTLHSPDAPTLAIVPSAMHRHLCLDRNEREFVLSNSPSAYKTRLIGKNALAAGKHPSTLPTVSCCRSPQVR